MDQSKIDDGIKKKVILVAGMHRSGTSAITGVLSILGCTLPKTLMPAAADNQRGFWESTVIQALNDKILSSLGQAWYNWKAVDSSWYASQDAVRFREKAQTTLENEYANNSLLVLKDPRICLLLPFWIETVRSFGAEPIVIIPIRNPLEIAMSLEIRNKIHPSVGHLIWLRHVLDAEAASRGLKRSYLRYDELISNPKHVIGRLIKDIGFTFPRSLIEKSQEINSFLTNQLNHHLSKDILLLNNLSFAEWIRSSFEIFNRWTLGKVFDGDIETLNRINVAFNAATLAFNPVIIEMTQKLNAALSERDVALSERDVALSERDVALSERDVALSEQDVALSERDVALSERDVALSERDVALSERDVALSERDSALSERDIRIAQITSSNSWKVTLPLREVGQLIRKPKTQVKQYLKGILFFCKRIYKSLPMSTRIRVFLDLKLKNYTPKLVQFANRLPATTSLLPNKIVSAPLAKFKLQPHQIWFPTTKQPLISIIIPIYNHLDYTLRCLKSIMKNPPSISFEVIIVDDFSTDNSAEVLQTVEGLRIISKSANKGFIHACNDGAKLARGEYLHFLNNDTEVSAGWLDELLRTFFTFPGTGLVGSKLVYSDGSLQEAGGIVWKDGSAWNFGRNQDALLPVYNYARNVDYCSGASIVLTKALFIELGGFDELYCPAYYEDTDLAFKVRERGYRVIYQPLSVVVHHESITSSTRKHKMINVNLKKFYDRWQDHLTFYQANSIDVDTAKDRGAKYRVLVLDHCTPTPDQDAGSIIAINIMFLLRDMGFQITFIPEDNYCYLPDYTSALQRAGIEVLYAPYCTSVNQHIAESGHRYDLVFLFRIGVVDRHLQAIRARCPQVKVIFVPADLHYLRMRRESDLLQDIRKRKASDKVKKTELAAICAVDASIVHSTFEKDLLIEEIPNANVHVFPLIHDIVESESRFEARRDIVFVGGYKHPPNVDAVIYFVSKIMPGIRQRLPGVRFHIVGSNLPTELKKFASDDIVVTGFVEDLPSYLESMRIFVSPLRYGAGTKGKVGTAMAAGLPLVGTSITIEGMELIDGKHVLVADDAEEFADSVAKLYRDEQLWMKLSKAGLKFARDVWGADAGWERLSKILGELGFQKIAEGQYSTMLYSSRINNYHLHCAADDERLHPIAMV